MQFPLVIPDRSKVIGKISYASTQIAVLYNELEEYFNWIRKQPDGQIIKEAARLTLKILTEGVDLKNSREKWGEIETNKLWTL